MQVKSLLAHGADPRLHNTAGKMATDYIASDPPTDRVGQRWTEIRALLATERASDTEEVSVEHSADAAATATAIRHHHHHDVAVAEPPSEEIRVMTYNILNGGNANSTDLADGSKDQKPSDVFSWPHRRDRVFYLQSPLFGTVWASRVKKFIKKSRYAITSCCACGSGSGSVCDVRSRVR